MKRSAARELAMRFCFMLSENPTDPDELLKDMFEEGHYKSLAQEDSLFEQNPGGQMEYISRVVRGVGGHSAELGGYIEKYSVGWDFARISRTALSIMKTAMFEIMYMPDIPESVSVNEAVELAKKYDEAATVPFINGVLGAFIRGETI
jgi:transcription antitermination protein NusB